MKNVLYILIFLFLFTRVNSQVAFCPAGAQWSYAYMHIGMPPYYGKIYNRQIKYIKDSIVGQDACKVLRHSNFFENCDFSNHVITVIKQKGDTIFFRSANTNHSWEILYNFDVGSGDQWTSTVLENNLPVPHYITVYSTGTTTINNVTLRQIQFQVQKPTVWSNLMTYSVTVNEIFGATSYLFYFPGPMAGFCDLELLNGPLCYEDSAFGLYKFTTMDCNINQLLTVGLDQKENGKAFQLLPSPATECITVVSSEPGNNDYIEILNVKGELMIKSLISSEKQNVDITELQEGFYFVLFYQNNLLMRKEKLIKQ